MNNNKGRFIIPLLGIAAAMGSLFVIATVLTGNGNQLAKLFRYLLLVGFVAGMMFPRGTLIFWLGLCGYTDLLKRFMVVFGTVQHSDLYYILGIPPMMIGGITLAVVVGGFTGRFKVTRTHWWLFGIGGVLMLVSAAIAAKEQGGSIKAIIPAIANDGLYTMLIFLLPVLFKDTQDVLRLTRVLLWAYVPVALYGVFQQIHGFQAFEVAYLKSGLTLEIKQLYTDEVRAFSTLNSPTAFSAVCAMLCVMSLMLTFTPRREDGQPMLRRVLAFTFVAIYFAGIIASTSRSSVLLLVVAMGGFYCFRSRFQTRILYAGMITAFVTLVLTADIILGNLDSLQSQVSSAAGGNQFTEQLLRVGTYSDRLQGFSKLAKNPEVYTFFGHGAGRGTDERDPFYAHDMLSNILVVHGVVPLLGMMLVGGMILIRMHRLVLQLEPKHHRKLGAGFLSLGFSLFVLSMVSGSVIAVFPVNSLLWLCFAQIMLVRQGNGLHAPVAQEAGEEDEDEEEKEHEQPQRMLSSPRVPHRFTRSGYSTPGGGT